MERSCWKSKEHEFRRRFDVKHNFKNNFFFNYFTLKNSKKFLSNGDGFQNGGALIVGKNGKQLYEYIQEDAADHISAEEIFKALNIKP